MAASNPTEGRGVRYAHTNLVAHDWRKMMDFYRDVFGCEPVGTQRNHVGHYVEELTGLPGARIQGQHLRLPGHGPNGPTMEVFQYDRHAERPSPAANRPGFTHIAFEVENVEATRRAVLDKGGDDLGKMQTIEITGAGRLTLIYMTDPEGNIIELQRWHRV